MEANRFRYLLKSRALMIEKIETRLEEMKRKQYRFKNQNLYC